MPGIPPPPGPPPRPPMPPGPPLAAHAAATWPAAAGSAGGAALRKSTRHEPALLTAHAWHAAGLALRAEAAYAAEHPLSAPPAPRAPFAAHHREEHRVDLAGCARCGQGVSRRADRESRRKAELCGDDLERLVRRADARLLTGLRPRPVCPACPVPAPGCPGAPVGVPTVPRNGAGAWRRSPGRAAAAGCRSGRRSAVSAPRRARRASGRCSAAPGTTAPPSRRSSPARSP